MPISSKSSTRRTGTTKSAATDTPSRRAPPGQGLQGLPGVGPATARSLAAAGLVTRDDLLWWLPLRFEDRRHPVPIASLSPGGTVCVRAKLLAVTSRSARRRGVHVTEALVADATGSVHVVWFNQPWLKESLPQGTELFLFGRVELFSVRGGLRLQMESPEVEKVPSPGEAAIHLDRIVPVYRKVGNLPSKAFRTLMFRVFEAGRSIPEVLPRALLREEGWAGRGEAFLKAHFPDDGESLKDLAALKTPAFRQLAFEEMLGLQSSLMAARQERKSLSGVVIRPDPATGDLLRRLLPFHLTGAQRRVLKEIVSDLESPAPMYRLLHGDVGSGKTVVAFLAMIMAAHQGFQAAFMAPTEVLAGQQFKKLQSMAGPSGMPVGLLTAAVKGKARRDLLADLASGELRLIVGTHSLFQEGVDYASLGMVVIDEQHRFGVVQRARLVAKGREPNVLVMSATPIPRSLALTLYGDLDLSVLDELPPGRREVVTAVRGPSARHRVEEFLRREMDAGRQVFVIYPLVEESAATDLQAATQGFQRLTAGPFRGYPAALLHGRMKPREKEAVMERLRSGEIRLLVATSVVEVGVDLPEASVMMVEHAERFGLAQLHQFRGRVGRAGHKGYCILMQGPDAGEDALKRLKVLEGTRDGFAIAEADLQLRGAGEPAGTQQWGGGGVRLANPLQDFDMLQKARNWAARLAAQDFTWDADEKERFNQWIEEWQARWGSLGRIG